jgi:Lrp/AsnC family leucine-responsive transcriptional regulator
MATNGPLDATNRLLIRELQGNARLSLAELGRRVGLSSPAVAERLQRLEQSGAITGYHAEVDPRVLGLPLSAIIRAHLRDVLHLEEVIDRFTVLGQTTTSVMQSSPVPGRPVELS